MHLLTALSTVNLTVPGQLKAKYRKTLKTDWDADSLDGTIALIDSLLTSSGLSLAFPGGNRKKSVSGTFLCVDDELLQGLARHVLPVFPPFGSITFGDKKPSEWDGRALRCFLELLLQLVAQFEGDTDFLRDAQSLLFLQAVFVLLPDLKSRRRRIEHDAVVAALLYHSNYVWGDEESHRLYLISEIAHYLGFEGAEGTALYNSYCLTPFDDHAYLTVVQQYLTFLLDHNRTADAKAFLLAAHKRGPASAAAEIQEMLDLTYEAAQPP